MFFLRLRRSAMHWCAGLLVGCWMWMPAALRAQTQVELGGTAYLDYFYFLATPEPADAEKGMHGFTYRRLYLTTDFQLAEGFSGRARLEASASTLGSKGPVPYVKDLYLRWQSEAGHRLSAGVMPPPAFEISEDVWGFRSLEKTILDLFGIVDSRDFGVRADGPLAADGQLRYAVMVANNSAVRPETDRFKRVYAQLQARPAEHWLLTLNGDVAGYEGDDGLESGQRLSAFGGYAGERVRAGVEGFWHRAAYDAADALHDTGVSLFGIFQVADDWAVVTRADRVRQEGWLETVYGTFALAGVAYQPIEQVRLIPNLHWMKYDAQDAALLARVTLDVQF